MWSHKQSVSSQYGVSIYSLAIQAANVANVLWFGQAAAGSAQEAHFTDI